MDSSIIFCFYLIAVISIAEANPQNVDRSGHRKRTVTDPVSNFLSELGNLFLDIDQTVSAQTAPKVSYEDRIAAQIFRPLQQPPRERFTHIRENYKTLQQRLGSMIDQTLKPLGESLSIDSYKTDETGPKLNNLLQTAFAPLKLQRNDHRKISVEEQSRMLPAEASDNVKNGVEVNAADLETTGGKPQGSSKSPLQNINGSERSLNQNQAINTEEQLRKIVQKMLSDAKRTNELLSSMSSKALDDVSSVLVKRMGDIPEDDSKPQERIIGEVLESESRFDKYMRQLLQTHGRWVLDNPLLNLWRDASKISRDKVTDETTTEETSTEPLTEDSLATLKQDTMFSTKAYVLSSSESQIEVTEPTEVLIQNLPESHPLSATYYQIDDGEKTNEEMDIILGSVSDDDTEDDETEEDEIEVAENEVEEKMPDTVILAFTPDGIPLKLRMDPEIKNPLKYLHKILRSAGVSLKVPVESYEDIEPVGKEVLLLGEGADITRSVYIDVSNRNELKSLLRTLMISKASGRK